MHDSNGHLSLRQATKTDEVLLFEWANDPVVRQWSFSQASISFNDHKKWFREKLNDTNVLIWIFEDHSSPAGMVRLEKKDNQVLLNYLIAPQSRGKKLASEMLRITINEARNHWQNIKVFAYTLPRNTASIKTLEKVGFYLENSNDGKNCYIFDLNENIVTTGE